ncbi:MAG: hypothetical protein ACKVQV_11500 [Bacteroidia bacterium]
MELPKQMLSKIIETESGIIISTPKKKSWILIVALSLVTLQFSNAIFQILFFPQIDSTLPTVGKIAIIALSILVIYFALKGLLWQLIGRKEISISNDELKFSKLTPLWTKMKTYKLADIKSINIKDESVSEGAMAMLQLLRITDKIKITFTYGYETITTISGIDIDEGNELKNKIENQIRKTISKL